MGNVTVTVQRKGQDPLVWVDSIDKYFHFEFQDALTSLAENTVNIMQSTIKTSIKREGSTGTLENSINYDILSTTAGVVIGIGNKDRLPVYWEVIDAGGYIPPANLGYFGNHNAPAAGAGGKEQWFHTGNKSDFLVVPTKPIEPVGYVYAGANNLKTNIKILLNKVSKNLIRRGYGYNIGGAR